MIYEVNLVVFANISALYLPLLVIDLMYYDVDNFNMCVILTIVIYNLLKAW